MIATGIKPSGHREVLGLDELIPDDAAAWTGFLRGLRPRWLSGVRLVVAESHPGLKEAIAEVLPDADWQRCWVRALHDLLTLVPKPAHALVATMARSIYAQPDSAAVRAQHARVVAQLHDGFPEAAAMLAEAAPDLLAFASFPTEH